jgi:ATP-dependent Zn protease
MQMLQRALPVHAFYTLNIERNEYRRYKLKAAWFDDEPPLYFRIGDHPFYIRTQQRNPKNRQRAHCYDTIIGAKSIESVELLVKSLNSEVRSTNDLVRSEPRKVMSFSAKSLEWYQANCVPNRGFDTVYIDDAIKKAIISHVNDYISSEQDYIDAAMRYHTCIMLRGPPGTGKTSIAHAISTMTMRPMYCLVFDSTWTSETLIRAMSGLRSGSLFLIEESDALFVERQHTDANKSDVSFSTFLNVVDGMYSPHDVIFIFTTNSMDHFDEALKRPGRLDAEFEIPRPSRKLIHAVVHAKATQMSEENRNKLLDMIHESKEPPSMAAVTALLFAVRKERDLNNKVKDALDRIILKRTIERRFIGTS